MGDLIQFPKKAFRLVRTPETDLDDMLAKILVDRLGWMYGTRYGAPDIPLWIGESWHVFGTGWAREAKEVGEETIDWDRVWTLFVDRWLAYQPEWRDMVNRLDGGSNA